jgi:hypothetical protein
LLAPQHRAFHTVGPSRIYHHRQQQQQQQQPVTTLIAAMTHKVEAGAGLHSGTMMTLLLLLLLMMMMMMMLGRGLVMLWALKTIGILIRTWMVTLALSSSSS